MQVKITGTNYSYLGDGLLSMTATVEIRDDDGGILRTNTISTKKRISTPDWKKSAITELTKQAQAHYDEYKKIMLTMATEWPTAKNPADIMTAIASEIEGGIK